VFPLAPHSKRPAVDQWETRATTDPDRIRACWSTGGFGVGVACGPSGVVVVDLDQPKPGKPAPAEWRRSGIVDGHDVLAAVCEDAGQPWPPATFTIATPSGGTHLYYRQPAGLELRNTQGEHGGLGWLVDTRGHGGYVAAAPGTRVDGRAYTVVDDAAIAELPGWLADRLAPAPLPPQEPVTVTVNTQRLSAYVRAAVDDELRRVHTSAPGGHNTALFRASVALGQLVAGGALDETAVTGWLLTAGIAVGQPEREARRTIASGLANGAKRPRQVAA
jgi:hypothetical protein